MRSEVDYKSPVAAVAPREESRLPTPSLPLLLQLRAQVGYTPRHLRRGACRAVHLKGALMNPNEALWKKGDFVRMAEGMREGL